MDTNETVGLSSSPPVDVVDAVEAAKKNEHERKTMLMQLDYFVRLHGAASFRKERCELLMKRKCAAKWPLRKAQRMSRRLQRATYEIEQSNEAVEQLSTKLNLQNDNVQPA